MGPTSLFCKIDRADEIEDLKKGGKRDLSQKENILENNLNKNLETTSVNYCA